MSPAELAGLLANIGINRIVLYIDDLDRCPPKHVVEVLQAIHLLLSFPIFVVVVGVDSRWMSHSLAKEYPSLLTRGPNGDAATKGWSREDALSVVTPADYLEKIFQIPFWVPPLSTGSAQKLLGKLTEAVAEAVSFGAASNAPASPPEAGARTDAPAVVTKTVALVAASNESRDATPSPADRGPAGEEKAAPPVLRMRPDLLRVAHEERSAMQSLAALIGRSPRATKRFVNSYRLLKVALVVKEPARFRRDSESAGDLTAPMFLLGIVTGLPTLAAEYVRMLPANLTRKAVDQLAALADWAETDVQHADAVKRIREFRASADASRWNELSGRDLLAWSTRVAQFSFEDLVPSNERSPASLEVQPPRPKA